MRALRSIALAATWLCVLVRCGAGDDGGPRSELLGEVGGGPGPVPATAPASSSVGAGGATAAAGGASSTMASSTVSSSTTGAGGAACNTFDEPNELESEATALGSIDDCDDSGSSRMGTLEGATDVDWFRYVGTDAFGCQVDPTRVVSGSGSFRVCKFASCLMHELNLTCGGGSTPAQSPDGRAGCCHDQSFSIDVSCGGIFDDEDAEVFIRIDQPGDACVEYSLGYHY